MQADGPAVQNKPPVQQFIFSGELTMWIAAAIAFAIGILLIISDWRMSTPPDLKTKKRPPLSPTDRKRLRDMFLWTIAVSLAAYFVPLMF